MGKDAFKLRRGHCIACSEFHKVEILGPHSGICLFAKEKRNQEGKAIVKLDTGICSEPILEEEINDTIDVPIMIDHETNPK